MRKGIILAGGSATRMGNLARAGGKHVLPVGGMPMICHPLKKLTSAGIKDILIVTSPAQISPLVNLLGSGDEYECDISFKIQDRPGGIAQALGLAENFVNDENFVVILGDNVWSDPLPICVGYECRESAWVCVHKVWVSDLHRYGVAVFNDEDGRVTAIEEKPDNPKSDFAVCGIYSYPCDVFNVIRRLPPSLRGEVEITDVNNYYISQDRMEHAILGGWWIDAGEPEALVEANQLILEKPINW